MPKPAWSDYDEEPPVRIATLREDVEDLTLPDLLDLSAWLDRLDTWDG